MENDIYTYLDKNLYALAPKTEGAISTIQVSGSEVSTENIVSGEIDGNISFIGGFIQSKNFVSGSAGWRLSADGTLEAINATLSGAVTATSGTIGGFSIGSDYLRDAANSFGLASTVSGSDDVRFWAGDTYANRATAPFRITEAGEMVMTQSIGTVKFNTSGVTFLVSTTANANIILASGASPVSAGVDLRFVVGGASGDSGAIYLDFIWSSASVGKLTPGSGDTIDLGDATNFFNDISYKTLTDRGCLGWFDDGVEMLDGRKVKDTEALLAIRKHPTRKTVYGVEMFDYSSMPKAVYRPAPIAEEDVIEPGTGRMLFRKGEKMGEDGAETTALISIMIGAIKELTIRVNELERNVVL